MFKLRFYDGEIFKNMKEINEFFNSSKIVELEIENSDLKTEEVKTTPDYSNLYSSLRSLKIKNQKFIYLSKFKHL